MLAIHGGRPVFERRPRTHPVIGELEKERILALLESGSLTQLSSPIVGEFEQAMARSMELEYGIAVNSGTASIHVALAALGVGEGDEVILPAFTFVGTAGPILHQRATPVFADILPESYCLDPNAVRTKITPRTKAILAVDLFGHPAPWQELRELAQARGVPLIEDACQAHGARYQGRPLGHWADLVCLSFQESKNMTTGEGGMVLTSNPQLAQASREIRHQGEREWHKIVRMGYNYRMTGMEAALGLAQLEQLPLFNQRRREAARIYAEALAHLGLVLPAEAQGSESAWHLYSFLLPQGVNRDSVRQALMAENIPVMLAYPSPLYASPIFSEFGTEAPTTERVCQRILNLPTHHCLSPETVERIAQGVVKVFHELL